MPSLSSHSGCHAPRGAAIPGRSASVQRNPKKPNVVAASATGGLYGREGALIRKTLIPTLYYPAATGVIGCVVLW